MKENNCKDLKFNPFNMTGGEWMLTTAGNMIRLDFMRPSFLSRAPFPVAFLAMAELMRASICLTKTIFLLFIIAFLCGQIAFADTPELKPRVVILTDIAPGDIEPDDMESMVRLMTYADQLEIEALITTIGWNCDPYPSEWADSLYRVIAAYEQDVHNLMKRSGQQQFMNLENEQHQQQIGYWPSPQYLRSRVAMGSQHAGIVRIGADNDTPGSELIIRLVDEDDPRPVYVCCWGSANTLAQAIWHVRQKRSTEQLKDFLHKLRVYTITDQDMVWAMRMNRAYSSHQWLRKVFADDLLFVWDESAWLSQNELGSKSWKLYANQIQGHGHLGKVYPNYKWGVEGDTPSFLNVLPNGLHDPDHPEQIGWAGCFRRGLCPDSITTAWTNWQQPQKGISRSYEDRFYPATFNDFAARIAWAEKGQGNRNPIVIVNGTEGTRSVELTACPGGAITLNASRSSDPDGDNISFKWWIQRDAGNCPDGITVDGKGSTATITIPQDVSHAEIHVVCEVEDDGTPSLNAYRRVIVKLP